MFLDQNVIFTLNISVYCYNIIFIITDELSRWTKRKDTIMITLMKTAVESGP